MQANKTIAFGRFNFDPARLVLTRDGGHVPLGGRASHLLAAFLEHRGSVLTKAELIDAVWAGAFVEESNLSVQIAHLRTALGHSADITQWIVTVPGIGYRFTAASRLEHASAPPAIAPPPGVAILPFADFDSRPGGKLGDGIAEDVLTALSRFKSVSVAARSSSFCFDGRATDIREAARRLGVSYVVEGSIRHLGARLRLSLQLIDGATGAHLWAESLDHRQIGSAADADDLAGRAAAMIGSQVHLAEIGRTYRERPDSVEAYDLYLRARHKIQSSRQDDNADALALYLRALDLAPDNVEFLAGAAEAIHHRTAVGWAPLSGIDSRLSLQFVRRGMDAVATDASALGLFGNALCTGGEQDLGEAITVRAAELNGNSTLALVCAGLTTAWGGELDQSEAYFRRAIELGRGDPSLRFALAGMAKVMNLRGDHEQTLVWARRANAFSPGLSGPHWHLIASSALLGRMDDARRYLDRYGRIAPGVTIDRLRAGQHYRNPAAFAPALQGLRLAGLPER